MLAPICLFTYNRSEETRHTVEALRKNFLAAESDLYIFSDGHKNEKDKPKVEAVREYLHSVTGFKNVIISAADMNKGLANSIISGVSQIIEKHGKVIVLEDDLITSPNFLNFMNDALLFYKDHEKIFSVSGYTLDLTSLKNYTNDYYLGYRASSWGWGTWYDRWKSVCWEVQDFNRFIWNPVRHFQFLRGGSDMSLMLWRQMRGKIDSWAIKWCYHQFTNDLYTVFPSKSKIISIGFGDAATHTKKTSRFNVVLDSGEQIKFIFDQNPLINKVLTKQFRKKFSIINRLKDRLNR